MIHLIEHFLEFNFPNANSINLNINGNIDEPSRANLNIGYNVNVRLFDGHNYQLGKAMHRLAQRNLRYKYENLKYNESIRITIENTRIQDAIQYFENVQLTYNRFKVNNKFQMKGSFLDDSLVLKDMTIIKRIGLLRRIVKNEVMMIQAKTVLAASILRVNTVCRMIDTIHKGYLE